MRKVQGQIVFLKKDHFLCFKSHEHVARIAQTCNKICDGKPHIRIAQTCHEHVTNMSRAWYELYFQKIHLSKHWRRNQVGIRKLTTKMYTYVFYEQILITHTKYCDASKHQH